MRASRQTLLFARQLYRLSLADDQVSAERVAAVLSHLNNHPPPQPLALLQEYRRLVARQLDRSHAVVEHAGAISDTILRAIGDTLSHRYGRPIAASSQLAPELIAGLRIRVGDDVFESSIAGQLAVLATST
jgi:F-type H+-transporting ATPase subunit delta